MVWSSFSLFLEMRDRAFVFVVYTKIKGSLFKKKRIVNSNICHYFIGIAYYRELNDWKMVKLLQD